MDQVFSEEDCWDEPSYNLSILSRGSEIRTTVRKFRFKIRVRAEPDSTSWSRDEIWAQHRSIIGLHVNLFLQIRRTTAPGSMVRITEHLHPTALPEYCIPHHFHARLEGFFLPSHISSIMGSGDDFHERDIMPEADQSRGLTNAIVHTLEKI